jgi:hypothetical protein
LLWNREVRHNCFWCHSSNAMYQMCLNKLTAPLL